MASLSLGLAGCDRAGEGNANAPGSPGTGNAREVARPTAPDTPPGGPSGVKRSIPHPGSSGGDVPPGTSGRGTADAIAATQSAQPGVGLAGGMSGSSGLGMTGSFPTGTATQSSGAGAAPGGSSNRSPSSGAGTR